MPQPIQRDWAVWNPPRVCRNCRFWDCEEFPYGRCTRIGSTRETPGKIHERKTAYVQGEELRTTDSFACNLFDTIYGILPPGGIWDTEEQIPQFKDGEELLGNAYVPPSRGTCWHFVGWREGYGPNAGTFSYVSRCGNKVQWLQYGLEPSGTICGLCQRYREKDLEKERKNEEAHGQAEEARPAAPAQDQTQA
jgi:hypothetical protein